MILVIPSDTDLGRCDDALITRLAALVRKEAGAADNEAHERIKARMTWTRSADDPGVYPKRTLG